MQFKKYSVKLTGETPLLMHQDNIEWCGKIKRWQLDPSNKKKSVAGDDRSPALTWIGSLYTDKGLVCIPADNLMTLIREGGARVPTGKKGGSFKAMTQSGIVVDQSSWTLIGPKGKFEYAGIEPLTLEDDFAVHESTVADLGFSLFVKRAKIGQQKHVRVRPRFDVWSCAGSVTVLDDQISLDVIRNIFTYAGFYSGLCDWRPSSKQSPGQFGKFSAVVELVK